MFTDWHFRKVYEEKTQAGKHSTDWKQETLSSYDLKKKSHHGDSPSWVTTASPAASDLHRSSCWPHFRWSPRTPPVSPDGGEDEKWALTCPHDVLNSFLEETSPLCLAASAPEPSGTSAWPTLQHPTNIRGDTPPPRNKHTHQNPSSGTLTGDRVLDLCDVSEVSRVGDPQAAHAVSVPPLLQHKTGFFSTPDPHTRLNAHPTLTTNTYCKVPLEGFGSPVGVVSTNLTVVVDVQTMELIEPVWDRLERRRSQEEASDDWSCRARHRMIRVAFTFPSQPRGRFLGL